MVAPGRPTTYAGAGQVLADADGTAHIEERTRLQVTGTRCRRRCRRNPVRRIVAHRPWSRPGRRANGRCCRTTCRRVTSIWLRRLLSVRTIGSTSVTAVESYVRTHDTYNLNSPLPAQGARCGRRLPFRFAPRVLRAVRDRNRRAASKPWAYRRGSSPGYVGGDTTTTPGKRIFRGSDAHAWVQVYYPGVGWVDSDPTAGAVLHNASPSLRQRLSTTMKRWWQLVPGGRLGALVIVVRS